MTTEPKDVLEQNVSTLLESGGEPPTISDVGRARIRASLVEKFGASPREISRVRAPVVAAAIGVCAAAAIALILARFVGGGSTEHASHALADGSTYITEPGAKVVVVGPRHVRVEGAALLDVTPGKGMFIVDTARGRIEVLGTRFLVDAQPQKTTAAVVRGRVRLATDRGDVVLHAGEQGVAEPGRAPVRGPAPRLSHLASWTQAARREGRTIEPVRHGTLFARDPGVRPNGEHGEEYPLPIKQLTVDVVVEDRVARVALDQTFHNPEPRTLEGMYRFAIPPDAALQRLAMYVDGKLTESAVVERMQGRRIYEELVYRRIDPALLEYAGTGRLDLRVYPLPANEDKRLMVAYTQSLPKLYRDWTLAIPMPEADAPVGQLVVTARVKGCANCELTSPSHAIVVERSGQDAIVHYRRSAEKIGDAIVLHVREGQQQPLVTTKTDGADRYLMVRAPAELAPKLRDYRPRTWILLDDVSASRGALELDAQADLIDAFVREVDEDDKLAIVAFDAAARTKLVPTRVAEIDRRAVRHALEGEGGVGATDFSQALAVATKLVSGTNPDDAMIVYLGDGVITSGARTLDALRAQLAGKAHFIGVGVGDGPDVQTLEGLAAATAGYATTMDLSDDLGWRAFDLVATLNTSRVTGLAARLVDAGGQLVPATVYTRSAQLADGEELELVAKLAGPGTAAAVEISGTRDGAPWSQRIPLDRATGDADYLPRLWAQRHIAARLLAKHEPVTVPPCTAKPAAGRQPAIVCPTEAQLREQRDEAIRKDIVALGKQYFLLSRHTSLIVLENDAMYAQYGVRKGSGETWAPYAMPATLPIAPRIDPTAGAELLRAPLQIFDGKDDDRTKTFDFASQTATTGASLDLAWLDNPHAPPFLQRQHEERRGVDESAQAVRIEADRKAPAPSSSQAEHDLVPVFDDDRGTLGKLVNDPAIAAFDLRPRANKGVSRHVSGDLIGVQPASLAYLREPAFEDLSALVPALVADRADDWRQELYATAGLAGGFPIDEGAKRLLGRARKSLPSGIYHWDAFEIAVDDARRIGWRRTTDEGLEEAASYDGAMFDRRYVELGLRVSRAIAADDVALSLAYLPVLVADPAHYARWFEVKARGLHEVTLSTRVRGTSHVAYVMRFDDQARLVSIETGDGSLLVEVAWSARGPTTARIGDHAIAVGYSAEPVADATAWAQRAVAPAVVVELPARAPAYWDGRLANLQVGSAAWRHAQRQRIVGAAALQDRQTVTRAYDELRLHGGVELGDLVLASGGIATTLDDKKQAAAVASLASEPVAKYLVALRARGIAEPQTRTGLVGALWSLRAIGARSAANDIKGAVAEVAAMNDRAPALRLVAASVIGQRAGADFDDLLHAWDLVAVGRFKNLARAAAAQWLYARGEHDLAARQLTALVDHLDLAAAPVRLDIAEPVFTSSLQGPAGWQLFYAKWRDRVLAGQSYEHVMALLPFTTAHPADLAAALARASALAGDADRKREVARLAIALGQPERAAAIIDPLLKAAPTRELYQLAATLAQGRGDIAATLGYLEQAQDATGDEIVDINTVRSELGQIIAYSRQLALQASGGQRAKAVERALAWGARWRLVDPGNVEIDRQLGELLLAVGDAAGAWRQLSSIIERDPWSGTGYATVAGLLESSGKVAEALEVWQQAIVIDQTNPTPRLRKAQALIALGRTAEGDALLHQITDHTWHAIWGGVVAQAQQLVARGKRSSK